MSDRLEEKARVLHTALLLAEDALDSLRVKYRAQEILYDQNQQLLVVLESRFAAVQTAVQKWQRLLVPEIADELAAALKGGATR